MVLVHSEESNAKVIWIRKADERETSGVYTRRAAPAESEIAWDKTNMQDEV